MHARTFVAALAGGFVMYMLGFLLFGLALDGFMKANTIEYAGLLKDPPFHAALALHTLVFGWLIAFIFDQWADIRTFAGGAIGGGLIMFAIGLATDLGYLAFMNLYNGYMVVAVSVAAVTLMGAVSGGVIGAVLGKMYREPVSG